MNGLFSDKKAGKPFVFQSGDRQLSGKVSSTGSWEKFETESIGQIQLSSGSQKMVFKPNSKFDKGALMDLRELRLVPIK